MGRAPDKLTQQFRQQLCICKCTKCCRRTGDPGKKITWATRSNHIKADSKRASLALASNVDADPRLVRALTDIFQEMALEDHLRRRQFTGPRSSPSSSRTNTGPSSSSGSESASSGRLDDSHTAHSDADASGSAREAPERHLHHRPASSPARGAAAFFRNEALWHQDRHVGAQKMQDLLATQVPVKALVAQPLPSSPPPSQPLTRAQRVTLGFLHDWVFTHGTERQYDVFGRRISRHSRVKVSSLYLARKLARSRGTIDYEVYDMCRASCIAFVGPNADLERCPHCQAPHFVGTGRKRKPAKTFRYLPFYPRIQAMFANVALARSLSYASPRLAKAYHHLADDDAGPCLYGDLHDGFEAAAHATHLQDARDCFVALSTDGAQMMNHKKDSSGWLALLQLLNLPPGDRFSLLHHHASLLVPGPNSPKDIQSFLWPLCAELAHLAATGIPTWDANKKEWFRLRVFLAGVYADQKGSCKLNGHVGGNGTRGCRFCLIRAVFADNDGSSAYFPLGALLSTSSRNKHRRDYDPFNLPRRTKEGLVNAVDGLGALSTDDKIDRVWETGISSLPLVSFSPLFGSPFFFPIDPFHLFHLNVPSLMWKVWKEEDLPSGQFGLVPSDRARLGLFMSTNRTRYPSSFSSRAPKDIHLFSNSGYCLVEWASAFHHFVPPYLHEIGAPAHVQSMVASYVMAVDGAMSNDNLTDKDVEAIRGGFADFALKWESMYGSTDEGLSRMTISVHTLLHVADQILALGSIKATSQASCERYFAVLKRELKQFRFPYRVLENRTLEKTRMQLIAFERAKSSTTSTLPIEPLPSLSVDIHPRHKPLTTQQRTAEEALLAAIPGEIIAVNRFARLTLQSGRVRASRAERPDSRTSARVAFRDEPSDRDAALQYGEVIHLLAVETEHGPHRLAFLRLFSVTERHAVFDVGTWTTTFTLVPIECVSETVAILVLGAAHYVVRKRSWQSDTEGEFGEEEDWTAPSDDEDEDVDEDEDEGGP